MQQILASDAVGASTLPTATSRSAASWPAIFAGAVVAAACTILLVALGSGIGFASISPWPNHGMGLTAFAMTTAIWLIVTQWLASALGGYIAGRLRTRWIGTHTHEVFFRDTAHGFVTWALATLMVTAIAAGSAMAGLGAGAKAAGQVASGGMQAAASMGSNSAATYDVDRLLRMPAGANATGGNANLTDLRAEAGHIIANAITTGGVPDTDRAYLVDQVAARAGISQADAQARVESFVAAITDAQTKLKAEADAARKAASQASIFLALSMLVGAFIASVSAALGGRLRDEHV